MSLHINIDGFLRSIPCTFIGFLILNYIITLDIKWLKYVIFTFVFGSLMNKLLKHTFKSMNIGPRPSSGYLGCKLYPTTEKSKITWGMPSGHAQIVAVVVTFLIRDVVISRSNMISKYISISLLTAIVFVNSWYRVHLKCHTVLQVVVGNVVGVLFAVLSCGFV